MSELEQFILDELVRAYTDTWERTVFGPSSPEAVETSRFQVLTEFRYPGLFPALLDALWNNGLRIDERGLVKPK